MKEFDGVAICEGKMKIGEVVKEISRCMLEYGALSRLVVDIERLPNIGYYTTLWILKKDFENKLTEHKRR